MTQPSIDGTGHGIPRMLYASDGSKWYAVLVDSDGHVKIDVVTAALPTDAATQTTLASALTALQLIDDLRAALGSVNTDDLQVDIKTYPGSNTLGNFPFGYYDTVLLTSNTTSTGTTNTDVNLSAVPAGEVWVITHISSYHNDTTDRAIQHFIVRNSTIYELLMPAAFPQYLTYDKQGFYVLKQGDYIRVRGKSVASGKQVWGIINGYGMKIA